MKPETEEPQGAYIMAFHMVEKKLEALYEGKASEAYKLGYCQSLYSGLLARLAYLPDPVFDSLCDQLRIWEEETSMLQELRKAANEFRQFANQLNKAVTKKD